MRVLVAGATSVLGIPVLRELVARGHEVIGATRDPKRSGSIEATGAASVVVDVFAADTIDRTVADVAPDAVVSLLTTLPKRGPMRVKDFEPARRLWEQGAGNLVTAAQRGGVRRIVAESVMFAYGYAPTGPPLRDESDPYPGPPPPGGEAMLAALRGMEQRVLSSGAHSNTEGIVLRYGAIYGPDVPHDELFTRMLTSHVSLDMGDSGVASWIHIDDVATATAAALERGRGGELYNIVDDRPQSFNDFLRERCEKLGSPWQLRIPRTLIKLVAPYGVLAFGETWLPLSNAKAKADLGWTPIPR
jgi:nucleoside-diphosphate-sugar epimerase